MDALTLKSHKISIHQYLIIRNLQFRGNFGRSNSNCGSQDIFLAHFRSFISPNFYVATCRLFTHTELAGLLISMPGSTPPPPQLERSGCQWTSNGFGGTKIIVPQTIPAFYTSDPNFRGLYLFWVLHAGQLAPLSARLWTTACQEGCSELRWQTHQALKWLPRVTSLGNFSFFLWSHSPARSGLPTDTTG